MRNIRKCFYTVLVVLARFAFPDAICSQDNKDVHTFQDKVIHIPRTPGGGLPPGPPYVLGTAGMFEGEANRVRKSPDGAEIVQFWVKPSSSNFTLHKRRAIQMPANQWMSQRYLELTREHNPHVMIGDIVPLFGLLYRVTAFKQSPDSVSGRRVTLKPLDRSSWPEDITLDPYGYAIVNGGSLDLPSSTRSIEIRVWYDEAERTFKKALFQEERNDRQRLVRREDTSDVVLGEVFSLNTGRWIWFKVIGVVHPDSANRLRGWVEIRRLWPTIVPYGVDETRLHHE